MAFPKPRTRLFANSSPTVNTRCCRASSKGLPTRKSLPAWRVGERHQGHPAATVSEDAGQNAQPACQDRARIFAGHHAQALTSGGAGRVRNAIRELHGRGGPLCCQMKRRGFLHSAAGMVGGGLLADKAGHAQNAGSTVKHTHAISLMSNT